MGVWVCVFVCGIHFFIAELDGGKFEPEVLLSLEHCNEDDDVVVCVVDNCD